MENEVKVSVLCSTYNHKNYLKDALESFLNQNTTFKYEIIVNDDCSIDGTREILEMYSLKYPDTIRAIYHDENQYSKGISPLLENLIPKAKGKYVAFCEGDDFWIDNNKLQRQYDYMEKHLNCSLCTHDSVMINDSGDNIGSIKPSNKGEFISIEDVIINGGGFMATSSIFARLPEIKKFPDYFDILTLDYTYQIFFASMGSYVYCFNKQMSAYRFGGVGSWSSLKDEDFQAYVKREIELYHKKCLLRSHFNIYNNLKYDRAIIEADEIDYINTAMCTNNYYKLRNKKSLKYLKKIKFKRRLKIYLCILFPKLILAIKKIIRRMEV
ncbi:MAG: glycosyltransferase [Intestinibacter bartlettii]|uniref:glycosyltransferase n=1 Tax=Intestinibacter bartlettii TaxID=261299 RepID=UPI00291357D6|nr:glycosyltransferase [Intestinibacter bartlettii]MDU6824530.1 glycosyltransferase [Intestinibacter bartlettii]